MDNRKSLLSRLQAVEFALYDTILYLDAYPEEQGALAYYHKLCAEKEKLRDAYERKYGPLTADRVPEGGGWTWVDGPFPWEKEANG